MLEPCMLGPNFWSALRSLGRVCFFTLSFRLNIHFFREQKYKDKSQSQITKPESQMEEEDLKCLYPPSFGVDASDVCRFMCLCYSTVCLHA